MSFSKIAKYSNLIKIFKKSKNLYKDSPMERRLKREVRRDFSPVHRAKREAEERALKEQGLKIW